MHNFDSLTLKLFVLENKGFFEGALCEDPALYGSQARLQAGASLQKIQQPSRKELILTLRNQGITKKFYINIQPDFAHVCIKNGEGEWLPPIPKQAPMFCMLLRKYLTGARVVEFKNVAYERILEIFFNAYDEIGSQYRLCLAIELMGKHSNIILYNEKTKIIIGCAHNISPEKSSVRELYGGIPYTYPPKQEKNDILNSSYGAFFANTTEAKNRAALIDIINKNYYYFSKPLLDNILDEFGKDFTKIKENPLPLFEYLQNLAGGENFEPIIKHFEGKENINQSINEYFSKQLLENEFKKTASNLEKAAQKELNKIEKSLGLKKVENKAEIYKKSGELILQNIYNIQKEQTVLKIDDIKIKLDPALSASENAQKYFKLYQKEKNANLYQENLINQNLENKTYYEEILFQIKTSDKLSELKEIEEILIPQTTAKKLDKTAITIENLTHNGWQIYLGKNSKQNDYLISKIAKGEDFWFHTLNYPSSHIILKSKGEKKPPTKEILEFCARLTKKHSPLKDSKKASIIYTQKKYLKKPPCAKLGYVTYSKEKEIVI